MRFQALVKPLVVSALLGAAATARTDASGYGEYIKSNHLDSQFVCALELGQRANDPARLVVAFLAGRACSTDPDRQGTPCLTMATRVAEQPIRYSTADDAATLRRRCGFAQRANRSQWALTNGVIATDVYQVHASVLCDGEKPVALHMEGDETHSVTCNLPTYF